jgi:ABC-type transport system substrate-binding protein
MAAKTMYETLFEQNADGRYVPYLATSLTPSADFKVWTLKLRDGITFHDGAKFDAAAVKANLDASNGTQILTLGLARSACTAGTNLGFYSNILKNTVIDPLTLQINLHLANSEMAETLYASGRAFMRSPAQLTDPSKCGTTPIGTGPFKMSAWTQTEMTVVKNTNYWRKDSAGVQLPYLDKIKFVYAKEISQRANGVKSGTFVAIQTSNASDSKQMNSLRKNKSLQTLNSGAFYYPSIWFNTSIAPFNVKECRLAVSAAIDRAQYVKVRLNGLGEVATSVVGKNSDLYNKAGFQGFDLAKAKKLAGTCATALGKPLDFTFPTDTSSESQANSTFLKNQLAKAGITMNIKVEETAVIIKNAFPQTYQAMGLLLNEAKGAGFVMPFWVSNNFGPASPNPLTQIPTLAPLGKILNLSKTNDPVLDAALFAARGEGNAAKKAAGYKSATKIVQENGYSTAIATTEYDMYVNKKIKGIDGLPLLSGGKAKAMLNYGMNFTGVYIEK